MFLCLLYSQQLHHLLQYIHLLAPRNTLEKITIGWPSRKVCCDKNAEWFDSFHLSLSSEICRASSSVCWQPASQRSPGSSGVEPFSPKEAQCFVKVLKSLSWASRRKLLFDRLQLYPKSPTLLLHFWRRYCIYHLYIYICAQGKYILIFPEINYFGYDTEIVAIKDLNADGVPEIIVEHRGC